MPRQMHLGSLSHGVGGHVAGWRMPDAETHKERFEPIARERSGRQWVTTPQGVFLPRLAGASI